MKIHYEDILVVIVLAALMLSFIVKTEHKIKEREEFMRECTTRETEHYCAATWDDMNHYFGDMNHLGEAENNKKEKNE